MSAINVAVLVGSLRKESNNLKLAKAIEKQAGGALKFDYLQLGELPLYNQDFDSDFPAVCKQLKQSIESADALLFVTPEYNRSFPGVLKNAIDIASRPWGTNSFAKKPGGITGASIGAHGTSMAQQHLRNVLSYLEIYLLTQPEMYIHMKEGMIDLDGTIQNPDTEKFIKRYTDEYLNWIKRFTK